MALHFKRYFAPAVSEDEGEELLKRILACRGCRVERVISHTPTALLELRAALEPGMRLFTHFATAAPIGHTAWILDEAASGPESWDPMLAQELSVESGGFVAGAEASRSLSRHGYALFFAGRTIEYRSNVAGGPRLGQDRWHAGETTATLVESVYPMISDLYTRLTGSPDSNLVWGPNTPLCSSIVSGFGGVLTHQTQVQNGPLLALAVFALVEKGDFASVWNELATGRRTGWRWSSIATESSGIPYVMLTGNTQLDTALCEALAKRLDVPAAAVGWHRPEEPFAWWTMQPGEAPSHGQGRGAAEFVQCLMPATIALGEWPGVLRISR